MYQELLLEHRKMSTEHKKLTADLKKLRVGARGREKIDHKIVADISCSVSD